MEYHTTELTKYIASIRWFVTITSAIQNIKNITTGYTKFKVIRKLFNLKNAVIAHLFIN